MDHSTAHVLDAGIAPMKTIIIESEFTHAVKEDTLQKGEKAAHNKEQHLQADYYKKLGEVIINYDEVILFGPTKAKNELLNSLAEDLHFEKIKIDVQQADKMTDPQQHAFVKEYFSKTKVIN